MIKLRQYQETAVKKIRDLFLKSIKSILLVIPTGGGKTVIFTYISQQASLRNKKVLILVHRVELLRQTSEALTKFGVAHGMINPMYTPNFNANVQVASVQTLIKRLNYLTAVNWYPDTLIIDESHHANAGSWRKIVEYFSDSLLLGVTATPIRGDGQGLGINCGGLFEEIVIGPSTSLLISEGFLVKPIVFSLPPAQRLDLSGVKTTMGDYNKNDLANLVDKPKIIGSAVEHYTKICPGVPAVAFCVSILHAEHVAQEFRNAGFRAYSVDGSMDDDERKKILDGLGNGYAQIVTSCDLISEGTDIPAIGCAILLRPTHSKGLYMQQVGRALRTLEGKEFAYVLDHVGNVMTHGMPDADHEWTLDGEKKRKGKKNQQEENVRVQQCLSCFAVHEPSPVCPQCGHVYEIKANIPKQIEGELMQITADMIQKKEKRIEQGKSNSLEDLRQLAKQRGYHPRWADNIYTARQKKIEKIAEEKLLQKISDMEIEFELKSKTENELELQLEAFSEFDNLDF